MTTLEQPIVGPRPGHRNGKAIASLVLGVAAMACLVALAIMLALSPDRFDQSGSGWLLLPFFALIGGLIAAFLGSIAWIDVRRGVTDRWLLEAQLGTLLGGLAALAVVAALVVLLAFSLLLLMSFGAGID